MKRVSCSVGKKKVPDLLFRALQLVKTTKDRHAWVVMRAMSNRIDGEIDRKTEQYFFEWEWQHMNLNYYNLLLENKLLETRKAQIVSKLYEGKSLLFARYIARFTKQ